MSLVESASRWRLSNATISLSSSSRRASVVAMKPAPPVTKIRFPLSTARSVARGLYSIAAMQGKTVLFVGGGRHQRRAIERAQELGLRVVAVDRNANGPGLLAADVPEVVDFTDVDAVTEVA